MGTTSTGLSRIGQIAVTVTDLQRATAYYRDVLGMRFLFEAPGMSFFDCDGLRLMLGVAEGDGESAPLILYYRVDDIEAAHDELAERGVEFVHPPARVHRAEDHDLWLAFFRDVEGNLTALMSEVPRS